MLNNNQPESLNTLFNHPGINQLINLRWPKAARLSLIILLLNGWKGDEEWQPPKDLDSLTLRQYLIIYLNRSVRCKKVTPNPPLAFLRVSADRINDRLIILLRALGPEALSTDPSLPLRLRHEVDKIPILSEPHRRLLSTHIIPMSSGTAQGTGAGIDRSGYARSGPLTTLLPSQFALPDDVLLWRYL
ncbi:MAG: hypothetical protein OMM_12724, partial [Candidatus Magnetoglobus multicellularis str. Araruama]